jgi:hypothetical protein
MIRRYSQATPPPAHNYETNIICGRLTSRNATPHALIIAAHEATELNLDDCVSVRCQQHHESIIISV